MTEATSRRLPPKETYYRESGVQRYTLTNGITITGVSARTWQDFMSLLSQINEGDRVVVSPELMTYPHEPSKDSLDSEELVGKRVDEVRKFSKKLPQTTFVIGTPTFDSGKKPRNSAVFIKKGEVVATTHKRSAATKEEKKYFEMVPEENPMVIPDTDTAFLICADMPTARLYLDQNLSAERKRLLKMSGKEDLIGKNPKFLPDGAKSLVVISCWAIGSIFAEAPSFKAMADEYYRLELRNTTWNLMLNSNIEEVVVVDRSPDINLTKPLNGILKKQ